jgi:hypothetical protein
MNWKPILAPACGLVALAGLGRAQWADCFDTYATGSVLNGQGGWQQWDSAPNTTTVLSSAQARSTPNSAAIWSTGGQTSDLVHTFTGYTSGAWSLRTWVYVPGPAAPQPLMGKIYFLILSKYQDFGPYDWSVDVELDPTVAQWNIFAGSPAALSGPLLLDQWAEMRADIDLNADTCQVYYNGAPIGPQYPWTAGVFGANTAVLDIACVDLYHSPNTAGPGYWDDASLMTVGTTPPSTYCTAKLNSLGCLPAITYTGAPSASHTSGFVVRASNVRNNKSGLLFYGLNGPASLPFQGGTLCVAPQVRRTQVSSSGGTPAPANDCTGSYQIDMNAFAHQPGPPVPPAALLVPGTTVNCQWWGRDPGFPAPNNTMLSNALRYQIDI